MKFRLGKAVVYLMCGLLLAQPLAHARKSQDDDQQNQRSEQRSPTTSGGYLEQDKPRNNAKNNRDAHRNQEQPKYDSGYNKGSGKRQETPQYRREEHSRTEQRNAPIQRYEPAPRNEPAPRYESEPRYAPRQMNLSEAVSVAERNTGGRVLSAEPIQDNGQLSYRVKVLSPNGRVQVLFIDAQ